MHLLESINAGCLESNPLHAVIIDASPASDITQAPISRSIYKPTDLTVVTDGPRSFNEPEAESLGISKSRVGDKNLQQFRISEDMSISIVEHDV